MKERSIENIISIKMKSQSKKSMKESVMAAEEKKSSKIGKAIENEKYGEKIEMKRSRRNNQLPKKQAKYIEAG